MATKKSNLYRQTTLKGPGILPISPVNPKVAQVPLPGQKSNLQTTYTKPKYSAVPAFDKPGAATKLGNAGYNSYPAGGFPPPGHSVYTDSFSSDFPS